MPAVASKPPDHLRRHDLRIAAQIQLSLHRRILDIQPRFGGVPWSYAIAISAFSVNASQAGRRLTMRQYVRLAGDGASDATMRRYIDRIEELGLLVGEGNKPRRYASTVEMENILLEFVRSALEIVNSLSPQRNNAGSPNSILGWIEQLFDPRASND